MPHEKPMIRKYNNHIFAKYASLPRYRRSLATQRVNQKAVDSSVKRDETFSRQISTADSVRLLFRFIRYHGASGVGEARNFDQLMVSIQAPKVLPHTRFAQVEVIFRAD